LRIAGAAQSPFTPSAVRAVAAASAGVPRIVNTLCFTALTLAFGAGTPRVTEALIDEAVADLSLDSSVGQTPVCRGLPAPAFAIPAPAAGRAPALAAALLLVAVFIAGFAFWSSTRHNALKYVTTEGNAS
jgi:general secretion pathway protein A